MHRKMSFRAFIANKYIEYGFRRLSDEEFEQVLKRRLLAGRKDYKAPVSLKLRHDYDEEKIYGSQVLYFNKMSETGRTIFFFHGGAFVSEMTMFHRQSIDMLSKKSDSKMVVPLYPLIPFADHRATITFVKKLYLRYKKKYPKEKIIFMGDSAGGGLALTMCEIFAKENIAMPEKVIAFSPWMDVSMSNQHIPEYEDLDVLLYTSSLKFFGKKWAGSLDTKDYRVSPRFGDLSVIPGLSLYVGTNEILYPDVVETYEMMKDMGMDVSIHIGENMSHDYPIFPIPEGRAALKECAEEIAEV